MSLHDDPFDSTGRPNPSFPLVRFGAIGEGGELLKSRLVTWALTSLIVMLCYSAVSALVLKLFDVRIDPRADGFRVLLSPGGATEGIITMIVIGFFLGGMFRMACRQVRGLPFGIETLFSVTDVLDRLLIGSVLYGAGLVAGFACFVVPGFVVAGVLMFTFPLIVDGGLRPTAAIARSWDALKGQWLTATVFHLVAWFLTGIGSCCCVGIFFTAPLYALSIAVLYRDFFLVKGGSGTFPGKGPANLSDF